MPTDYTREMADINEEVQSNLRGQRQPSDAHYYAFNDANGRPQASLIVLIDDERRALRAELHYLAALSAEAQTALRRRAQGILGLHYTGVGPSTTLSIMDSSLEEPLQVDHQGVPVFKAEKSYRLWPVVALLAAVFLVVAIFWAFTAFQRAPEDAAAPAPAQANAAPDSAATATVALADTPPTAVDPAALLPQPNGLPPSRNADERLAVGMQARIRPGYKSFVRTQPGADQGEPVDYLEEDATVILRGWPLPDPGRHRHHRLVVRPHAHRCGRMDARQYEFPYPVGTGRVKSQKSHCPYLNPFVPSRLPVKISTGRREGTKGQ